MVAEDQSVSPWVQEYGNLRYQTVPWFCSSRNSELCHKCISFCLVLTAWWAPCSCSCNHLSSVLPLTSWPNASSSCPSQGVFQHLPCRAHCELLLDGHVVEHGTDGEELGKFPLDRHSWPVLVLGASTACFSTMACYSSSFPVSLPVGVVWGGGVSGEPQQYGPAAGRHAWQWVTETPDWAHSPCLLPVPLSCSLLPLDHMDNCRVAISWKLMRPLQFCQLPHYC